MGNKNLIIGTAGHIDHGKTTLIQALTGINTDRLLEEQKRGISIDLGFTSLTLPNQQQVGIIDVPGHEKFIKNMLAGAGGVDLGLLVIAADEGVMPQTEEHLAILDLLNVRQGIVVVTKTDLVDNEWLEMVLEDIRDRVRHTFLENAPIIPVSPLQDRGLGQLLQAIEELLPAIPFKEERDNVYFPIDRVFSLAGHGTVVTGTLIRGTINRGDTLKIYPQGSEARIRSLQVHDREVARAYPGQRVGINLAGVEPAGLVRGHILATAGSLLTTQYLDAELRLLAELGFNLKHGDRIRLHLGAREVIGRVYFLAGRELAPAGKALVQFRLEEEVVAYFKERFVLRRYSPMTTVGGGEILDSNPERHRRNELKVLQALASRAEGERSEMVETTLQLTEKHPLSLRTLVAKTGFTAEQIGEDLTKLLKQGLVFQLIGGQEKTWLHQESYLKLRQEIIEYLRNYHQSYHLRPGMGKEELRSKLFITLSTGEINYILVLLEEEQLIKTGDALVALADFQVELTGTERRVIEEIRQRLIENSFNPPEFEQIRTEFGKSKAGEEVIDYLFRSEQLIKIDERLSFDRQVVRAAEDLLKKYLQENGQIEMAQFRDLLKSSRKYTLPLLEYFDKKGVTRREGDVRVLLSDGQ